MWRLRAVHGVALSVVGLAMAIPTWARTPLPGEWRSRMVIKMPGMSAQMAAAAARPVIGCVPNTRKFAIPPAPPLMHCSEAQVRNDAGGLTIDVVCAAHAMRDTIHLDYRVSSARKSYTVHERSTITGPGVRHVIVVTGRGRWLGPRCAPGVAR